MKTDKQCELLLTCEFFSHEMKNEKIAKEFKKKYCISSKDACGRYMVAKGAGLDFIPKNLFPNEYDRVLKILSEH